MTPITRNYFECKVKHSSVADNGTEKMVSELYVVDALSYTEAEAKLAQEMNAYYQDWSVTFIKPANYKEIAFMSDMEKVLQGETEKIQDAIKTHDSAKFDSPINWNSGDVQTSFYRCTVHFITLNEKTLKEKRTKYIMLIEGTSLHNAVENLEQTFQGSMVDYDSVLVSKTKVVDVFLYK